MAVQTIDGVTTITPTAWKWRLAAAAVFFLVPPFGIVLSLILLAVGHEKVNRLVLRPERFEQRQWGQTRIFSWDEVSEFQLQTVKSGAVKAGKMITFTPKAAETTLTGRSKKMLSGGTKTIGSIGMPAEELVELLNRYKRGFVPNDTRPSPATPVRPTDRTPRQAGRAADTSPRFDSAPPRAPKLRPRKGTVPSSKQTPLVQEGGWFRRRGSKRPFG